MFMRRLIGLVFAGALVFSSALGAEIVVRVRPPISIHENRGPRPSRDHVWISGYHRYDNNAYAWTPGRWEQPPRHNAHWVAHRWVHRNGGYVLVEGHWQ
jgi:WXXGXW repeat (2 copies)